MGDQLRSSNADRKPSDLFGPIKVGFVGSLVSARRLCRVAFRG
jgi:hypothetical protein